MTPKELAALHAQCFTVPRPFSALEFTSLLNTPSVFLCAREHGFALGRVIADEAELLTLAVAKSQRRQGTGRALMNAFVGQAKLRGAAVAYLEVDARNAPAISLYHEYQFTEVGRRKAYYQHPGSQSDAIVMRRDLADDNGLQLEDRQ